MSELVEVVVGSTVGSAAEELGAFESVEVVTGSLAGGSTGPDPGCC